MDRTPVKSVIMTGGGTAGHIFPHLSIFEDDKHILSALLKKRELEVFYFGSRQGMEREIINTQAPHWKYIPIYSGKLRRYLSLRTFIEPFFIILGFLESFLKLRKIRKQSVLFSKGGFVSAPVVWGAWLNKIPVIIHESDLTPALTTRITMPFASKICISFPQTKKYIHPKYHSKIIESGVPVRPSLFSIQKQDAEGFFNFPNKLPTLFFFGGSLGSSAINLFVEQNFKKINNSYNIIHITGKQQTLLKEDRTLYPNYRQFQFVHKEMSMIFAISDLAICRAGATSIFELTAAKIPMLLIPLGTSQSRGDQIINAQAMEQQGCAEILYDNDLRQDPSKVVDKIDHMINNKDKYQQKQQKMTAETSTTIIANLINSQFV